MGAPRRLQAELRAGRGPSEHYSGAERETAVQTAGVKGKKRGWTDSGSGGGKAGQAWSPRAWETSLWAKTRNLQPSSWLVGGTPRAYRGVFSHQGEEREAKKEGGLF